METTADLFASSVDAAVNQKVQEIYVLQFAKDAISSSKDKLSADLLQDDLFKKVLNGKD